MPTEGEVQGQQSGASNPPKRRRHQQKCPAFDLTMLVPAVQTQTTTIFGGPTIFGETPPPEPPPLIFPPDYAEQLALRRKKEKKQQNITSAEVALAYYNKKHHTDYTLVDALGSGGRLIGSIWFHTSFTAKLSTPDDASAKLFFAEYEIQDPDCPIVHCCRILEGAKTMIGCHICGDGLVHPTSGFRQGLYRQEYRVLRPRY